MRQSWRNCLVFLKNRGVEVKLARRWHLGDTYSVPSSVSLTSLDPHGNLGQMLLVSHVTSPWLLISQAAAMARSAQAQVHLALRDQPSAHRSFSFYPLGACSSQCKPLQKTEHHSTLPSTHGDPASCPSSGQFRELLPRLPRRSWIKDPCNDSSYSSAYFPTTSFPIPRVHSHINHLHPSPCLRLCFQGNLSNVIILFQSPL